MYQTLKKAGLKAENQEESWAVIFLNTVLL
jgi:hypothetical protein